MKKYLIPFLFLIFHQSNAQFFKKDKGLAHTFSIVARDEKTGEIAVGVQSHWFSVGTSVSWAEAGVGADCKLVHLIDLDFGSYLISN